jgi:uncharacterized protein YlxW (UPF0749 family)
LLWHKEDERAAVASVSDAAERAPVPGKLHALCAAWKEVSSEFKAACMECNSLCEQVRDERNRRHTLPSEVVHLANRLKSARRKNTRLEEANEKLAA